MPVVVAPRTSLHSRPAHAALIGGCVSVIRVAQRSDADGVRRLHDACSAEALRDRYLGAPPKLTGSTVRALLDPPGGCGLIACAARPDGEPLAMAQVGGGLPVAEIAVLVRDDYQGRGLGTILASRAMSAAVELGYREMAVYGASGNARLSRLLIRLGLRAYARFDGSMLVVRAPLGDRVQ
jgi:GNAT superfamily N-acetyltransferase